MTVVPLRTRKRTPKRSLNLDREPYNSSKIHFSHEIQVFLTSHSAELQFIQVILAFNCVLERGLLIAFNHYDSTQRLRYRT